MYDTFEPFQEFDANEFDFQTERFEIWQDGNIIKKGNCNFNVICRVKEIQNENRMIVVLNETLNGHIKESMVFDKLISSNDRLVMLALPNSSNHNKIQMLTQMYGSTRPMYTFANNEAYTCSIFLKNGQISKLSFNIYGSEKMVELQ